MMEPFEIRRMRARELEATVSMWRRSRDDALPWLEQRMGYTPEEDLEFFGETVMREQEVWVAVRDDTPLGLLAYGDGLVAHLYVEPAEQATGIGSGLVDKAKELSPAGLRLFTHQRNERARAFYERRGFCAVKFGVSPAPESEPDVEYRWEPS
jgi:ribosomal protein S18 acetylase RimI-like enzyme